jgi:hypothetical protein
MTPAEPDCGPEACSATQASLTSSRVRTGGALEAIETCFERGWTDGLPVVPPTAARVADFLDAAGLAPEHVVGSVSTRENLVITAEKLAINAVMAGALPEYMPVIVAAMRALTDPLHNFHSHTATLSGAVQVVIVNGAVRARLNINSADAAFGPGWRANSTIGRALRLAIRNIARSVPGEFDRAAYSHPGRYGWCFGEDEEQSPWTPLAEDQGLPAGADAVTVYASMWHAPIYTDTRDPRELLRRIARGARYANEYGMGQTSNPEGSTYAYSHFYPGRKFLFVIGREHVRVLHAGGIGKEAVRMAIYQGLTEPLNGVPAAFIAAPQNVMLVVGRGTAMHQSWFFCPFHSSNPVTRTI